MGKKRRAPPLESASADDSPTAEQHSLEELSELVVASGILGPDRIGDPQQEDRVLEILGHYNSETRDDLVRRIATDESINSIKIKRFGADKGLTKAEQKLLESLCAGRSLAEHAAAHFISPNTARTHLQRIREKVGVSRQADIVSKALS